MWEIQSEIILHNECRIKGTRHTSLLINMLKPKGICAINSTPLIYCPQSFSLPQCLVLLPCPATVAVLVTLLDQFSVCLLSLQLCHCTKNVHSYSCCYHVHHFNARVNRYFHIVIPFTGIFKKSVHFTNSSPFKDLFKTVLSHCIYNPPNIDQYLDL